jgi:hypothetical protein
VSWPPADPHAVSHCLALMFPFTSTARNGMLSPVARKSDPPYRWQGPRFDRVVDARQTDIVGGIQGYRETALNRDDRRRGDRRKFVGPHAAILLAIVIQCESFLRRIGAQSTSRLLCRCHARTRRSRKPAPSPKLDLHLSEPTMSVNNTLALAVELCFLATKNPENASNSSRISRSSRSARAWSPGVRRTGIAPGRD